MKSALNLKDLYNSDGQPQTEERKNTRKNGISIDLKMDTTTKIASLFNKWCINGKPPKARKNITILIHKKGDKRCLKNFRPTYFLSVL